MLANLVRRGSQTRQAIEDSEYELVRIDGKKAIVRDKDSKREELYVRNDGFAGFVLVIHGQGYEFVSGMEQLGS